MKRLLKSLMLTGLAALVLMPTLAGCDLTELNDNPNAPSTATTPNLLANAQIDLADLYWDDYAGAFWVRYAQYWTTNQYVNTDRYGFPTTRAGANNFNWATSYLILNDLQEIIRLSRQTPEAVSAYGPPENQIAIAKIMQAWTFQVMTDMWGPIPFTEALQGRSQRNFSPAYSSQEAVYRGIIDSLTAASQMITVGEPALAAGDLVYGGDMSKWKKLANALKMRAAIRIADVLPDLASQTINEAIAAGAFESNADNAFIPFNLSAPYQNPFYENYEVAGRDDWTIPQSILGVMNATEDPRRPVYFTDAEPDTPGGQFNGFPYGLPSGEAQALFTARDFSRPGFSIRQPDSPAILMLYGEVLFIKAEAAQRGFISGDPAQFYRDAITASMNYWAGVDAFSDQVEVDITEEEINAYLSRVPYDNANGWAPEGDVTWKQTLGIQKWLAQYLQGMQGWSTWRRLDFEGVLQVPKGNPGQTLFGCDIAIRMTYPSDEATLNQENLVSAINNLLGGDGVGGGLDGDTQGIKLWWDVEAPVCN